MQFVAALATTWLGMLLWLAVLSVVFGVLVRCSPCNPGMFWWKNPRSAATDLVYWFLAPLIVHLGRTLLLVAVVSALFGGHDPALLPVRDWPLWLQCAVVLVLQDVVLYFLHRFFHTRLAWRFHAVHHAPKLLDWTAMARFHPVNNVLAFGVADVLVLVLGFSPVALAILTPFNTLYSAMVHANLNWTFGPLRYVLASPVFHRWHHTTEAEGLDKNFASTFPLLDVLFGTFYMPAGRLPAEYGNGEADYPEGFWGQLVHPFTSGGGVSRDETNAVTPTREDGSRAPCRGLSPTIQAIVGSALAACAALGWYSSWQLAGDTARLQHQAALLAAELDQQEWLRVERAALDAQLDLACQAIEAREFERARALLDAVAPPFREHWGRRHLRELCQTLAAIEEAERTPIPCPALGTADDTPEPRPR